jgi:hypothetical protein
MNDVKPNDIKIPAHPFVKCNIDGVSVHALVDTCSMKSFLRQDIYNIIDFEGNRVDKTDERCNSITGDSLNIFGKINANVNFTGSRYTYSAIPFIISSDIQFDCILGWDFLVNNNLDIQRDISGGTSFYSLKGPHGKMRVCAKAFSNANRLSGIVESKTSTEKPDYGTEQGEDSYLLFQSQYKAPIEVYLSEDVVIPARTEVTIDGKLVKTTSANVGMVKPHSSHTHEHDIHILHIVVHPRGKLVPVRIMNTSIQYNSAYVRS